MRIGRFIPNPVKKFLRKVLTINIDTHAQYVLPSKVENKQFAGKIAVVTGGGGGIGSAIAIRLATEGAYVFVLGRTEKSLYQTVEEIKRLGGQAEPYVVDVTEYNELEKCASHITKKMKDGTQLLLVNSAGGSARDKAKLFAEQDISVINNVVSVNLLGTINSCRAFSPLLMKTGGAIVNISSIIGIGGKEKCCDYAAAKAGIIGFTRSLAIEFSLHRVRCNCVSPGKIQRGVMSIRSIDNEINCNYVGYGGRPEDIAGTVSFLLGDEAKFITGQNIIVDGGRTLGLHGD